VQGVGAQELPTSGAQGRQKPGQMYKCLVLSRIKHPGGGGQKLVDVAGGFGENSSQAWVNHGHSG
jgi:hypothetical protein